ncbi:hypothetical protein [Desulfurivibrio dismutans]|uniref:hypothetical protein n=1 Tax=Desulfurivibrio dismutans TaxID=1398908 RepID=UPI0023DB70DB|nr:hypothetical protein [Desulfurivibrio alkaliphilus]MDF1614132.1 hypothetical protein [Desulfurivibrio alkaliphilus]
MTSLQVTFFTPYPFSQGQKIRITAGPRRGDWEVMEITEHKITLRCPVSGRLFNWDRFCYFAEDHAEETWPQQD